MICFEININNRKICIAGIKNNNSVISVIINYIQKNFKKKASKDAKINVNVRDVINYDKNEYENLKWIDRNLKIGDEINIKIIKTENIDKPQYKENIDKDFLKKQELSYYNSLKNKYDKDS